MHGQFHSLEPLATDDQAIELTFFYCASPALIMISLEISTIVDPAVMSASVHDTQLWTSVSSGVNSHTLYLVFPEYTLLQH